MQPTTTIVFSHANSFPAPTYRCLFEVWQQRGMRVVAIDKYGHDPRYPVSDNWPHLRDQLIHQIEREVDGAAWLVGHSLGGYLSVLAAIRRPDLVSGIVLLDSPIIGHALSSVMATAKALRLWRQMSPGRISARRRTQWANAAAARAHFAGKRAFAAWDKRVLDDFIAEGTSVAHALNDTRQLSFGRDIETAIYDTIPHHIAGLLRRHPLTCPLAFIGGTRSAEVKQIGMRSTTRLTRGNVSWIEGSHLFPFERPEETSEAVLHWLEQFNATNL